MQDQGSALFAPHDFASNCSKSEAAASEIST
jgi:hypothetical protein